MTVGQIVLALVVTAVALWFFGNLLATISQGPVDPGECMYAHACDR
jgi:hypothetical protein